MSKLSIIFPVTKYALPFNDDTIQIIIEFTTTAESEQTYYAVNEGLRINPYGKRGTSYDLEEAFLTPGIYRLEIYDEKGFLDDLLFEPGVKAASVIDIRGKLIVYKNGVEEFSGNLDEDSIQYDVETGKLKITTSPETEKINKRMVYDSSTEDNEYTVTNAVYSEGVVTVTFSIPHSFAIGKRVVFWDITGMTDLNTDFRVQAVDEYTISVYLTTSQTYSGGGKAKQTANLNPFEYPKSSFVSPIYIVHRPIKNIIRDIYRLVNPDIDYPDGLDIIHDWQFKGERLDGTTTYLNNISFVELNQVVDRLYFDNSYGISNCGDVLRSLAQDWASFTGLMSYNKAFFKRLFQYNQNNLQAVEVLEWKKNYKYSLLDYITVETEANAPNEPYHEGVFTEYEDRSLTRKSLTFYYYVSGSIRDSNIYANIQRLNHFTFNHGSNIGLSDFPAEGTIYSNNGSTFQVCGTPFYDSPASQYVTMKRITGTNDPETYGLLTKISGAGLSNISYNNYDDGNGLYQVFQARAADLFDNEFKDHGALLSKFLYQYRGNLNRCRVDEFTLKGSNYNYLKDFNYAGLKYQIISMTADEGTNTTECEAICLGAL